MPIGRSSIPQLKRRLKMTLRREADEVIIIPISLMYFDGHKHCFIATIRNVRKYIDCLPSGNPLQEELLAGWLEFVVLALRQGCYFIHHHALNQEFVLSTI